LALSAKQRGGIVFGDAGNHGEGLVGIVAADGVYHPQHGQADRGQGFGFQAAIQQRDDRRQKLWILPEHRLEGHVSRAAILVDAVGGGV
jgi:hypothetical protein